ncbi:hypothetical protein K469DRAFT_295260 [Zopfia rhizophila CBS 207.26]|uniref:Uncharacterized protein n=1 Tax=Zopfia rhizophila CBS 207.26 TaxID=1314779 RepID=A0A6A6DNG4_9PEZI|nr:hypothetical protein K469DRAFT_295260 [Zopfia rhizophila CBS 207.26]
MTRDVREMGNEIPIINLPLPGLYRWLVYKSSGHCGVLQRLVPPHVAQSSINHHRGAIIHCRCQGFWPPTNISMGLKNQRYFSTILHYFDPKLIVT